jgi:hypothetical protein
MSIFQDYLNKLIREQSWKYWPLCFLSTRSVHFPILIIALHSLFYMKAEIWFSFFPKHHFKLQIMDSCFSLIPCSYASLLTLSKMDFALQLFVSISTSIFSFHISCPTWKVVLLILRDCFWILDHLIGLIIKFSWIDIRDLIEYISFKLSEYVNSIQWYLLFHMLMPYFLDFFSDLFEFAQFNFSK